MDQWKCFNHWSGTHEKCYYLFDYYPASRFPKESLPKTDLNNRYRIWDFKCKEEIDFKVTAKKRAISNFADDLKTFPFEKNSVLIPGPTSLTISDKKHDYRMHLLLEDAKLWIPPYREYLLTVISHKANHESSERKIEPSYFGADNNIDLSAYSTAYIIDDIYTKGTHFEIWKNMINYTYPHLSVCGIFFGKTVPLVDDIDYSVYF